MSVQLDRIRSRVFEYVQTSQQRQAQVFQLETELRDARRELAQSRLELARVRGAPGRQRDTTDDAQLQDSEAELRALREQNDGVRRQLRHSHKVMYDLLTDKVRQRGTHLKYIWIILNCCWHARSRRFKAARLHQTPRSILLSSPCTRNLMRL